MKYEDEFFQVVNAKYNLLKLVRKGVINQDIASRISAANDDEGREILYHHLRHYSSVDTLREYCKVAIAANGYPNMQKLAEKIMPELPQGGWFQLSMRLCEECVFGYEAVHVCICAHLCVYECMCTTHVQQWTRTMYRMITFLLYCDCACVCCHCYWLQLIVLSVRLHMCAHI